MKTFIINTLSTAIIHMTPEQKHFAQKIATLLNDQTALPLYETFVRQHPQEALEELIEKVLSIPDHKIRRTRGALFTFLVKQYATKYARY